MNAAAPRLYYLIAIIALLAQGHALTLHAESTQAATSGVNSPSEQTYTSLIVGTWEDNSVRIELRADGTYKSWAPYLQSDLAAMTMLQNGKWSVRGRTLSLAVEKSFVGHVPPGTAFTYDIISVSSGKALLASPVEKREVTWTKVSAQAKPFWKGALSYEPPFKMSSYLHPASPGPAVGDWELNSGEEAGTNAHAQVVFHLWTVAEFIGTDRPAKALETVADLKSFMDSKLSANPRGDGPLTSIINIDGREALMFITPTNQTSQEPTEWRGGVCFFWKTNPVWRNSTICLISMTAETRETLNLLTNSLKTVKLLGGKQKN